MIKQPVKFGDEHNKTINLFSASNKEEKKSFWQRDEVEDIRKFAREHYLLQQSYECCFCGRVNPTDRANEWNVEHIVPRATHPQFTFEPKNLAVVCAACNGFKSDQNVLHNKSVKRYPNKKESFAIVHPHYDEYNDNIWRVGKFIYIPISTKGVETIHLCKLTRFGLDLLGVDALEQVEEEIEEQMKSYLETSDKKERELPLLKIQALTDIKFKITRRLRRSGREKVR
ncbi:hypothetical protein ABNQ38_33980 (plasmid) [Azospirillum sp. A29]|uniref:HNH endonuclease n=1 Tax=Azospirillum sp. A29 TaxID=3160606 RepID=UPI00366C4BF7